MKTNHGAMRAAVLLSGLVGVLMVACVPRFTAPSPDAEHSHLVVFNRAGGGMLRAFALRKGRGRLMAEVMGEGYRHVRIPIGRTSVRFETNIGGVRYPSEPIHVEGVPGRITLIGVDGPSSSIRVYGGPRGATLIDRVRAGDALRWSEVE